MNAYELRKSGMTVISDPTRNRGLTDFVEETIETTLTNGQVPDAEGLQAAEAAFICKFCLNTPPICSKR